MVYVNILFGRSLQGLEHITPICVIYSTFYETKIHTTACGLTGLEINHSIGLLQPNMLLPTILVENISKIISLGQEHNETEEDNAHDV